MPELCFALFVKQLLALLTGVLYVCLICSRLFLKAARNHNMPELCFALFVKQPPYSFRYAYGGQPPPFFTMCHFRDETGDGGFRRLPRRWDRWYSPKHVKSWSFTSGRVICGRPVVAPVSPPLQHYTTLCYCLRVGASTLLTLLTSVHCTHFRNMSGQAFGQFLK